METPKPAATIARYFFIRSRLHCLFIFLALTTSFNLLNAQGQSVDSASAKAFTAIYDSMMFKQSGIYNGPEYHDFAYTIAVGHPYFDTAVFLNGSVAFQGVLYKNVPLMYDIVNEQLVLRHFNKYHKILLRSEWVDSFSIGEHHFTRIIQDSINRKIADDGYYEELYNGRWLVLKRAVKTVQPVSSINEIKYTVNEKNYFFVVINNRFYPISKTSSLMKLFGARRKEVQGYLRSQKLKFRKNRQEAIVKAIAHYEQSTL